MSRPPRAGQLAFLCSLKLNNIAGDLGLSCEIKVGLSRVIYYFCHEFTKCVPPQGMEFEDCFVFYLWGLCWAFNYCEVMFSVDTNGEDISA